MNAAAAQQDRPSRCRDHVGCDFACLIFYAVYVYTPLIKQLTFCCAMTQKLISLFFDCLIAPCCAAVVGQEKDALANRATLHQ